MTEPVVTDPAANQPTDPKGDPAPKTDDWKPPASQADLDRIIETRLARLKQQYSDYDQLKEKAGQHDALLEELSSDQEKAVKKAVADALAEEHGKTIPRVVRQTFRAEAKGVLTKEQLDSLLEDRDLTKYVRADGEPDEEKIANLVRAFAPAGDGKDRRDFPDLGGGNRGGAARTTDMNGLIRKAAGRTG